MKCPKCGTKETIKAGSKITSEGKKQRYQCKICGHTFTEESKPTIVTNEKRLTS